MLSRPAKSEWERLFRLLLDSSVEGTPAAGRGRDTASKKGLMSTVTRLGTQFFNDAVDAVVSAALELLIAQFQVCTKTQASGTLLLLVVAYDTPL